MPIKRIDPKLLEILVCPLTKAPLRYDEERQELVSDRAGVAYPIRDGIPIMLADEARPLSEAERAEGKAGAGRGRTSAAEAEG
jgi:uncharacterized protein YbaR (Trm112 family)